MLKGPGRKVRPFLHLQLTHCCYLFPDEHNGMAFKFRLFLGAMATLAVVLYAVFLLPPLTSGGGSLLPGVTEAELTRAIQDERAYCEENRADMDCACFAGKSGLVLAAQAARVPTAQYANQEQLAREQAEASC